MSATRLEVAERIARSARALALKHFSDDQLVREKEPGHFVAPLDQLVDELVVDMIHQEFPGDRVFSEESGFSGGNGDHLWIVDPIDGTSNLRLGFPYIATALSVQYAGETVLSAVYNPFLDEMILAERGSGAFLNGQRLHVSDAASPSVGFYVQGYRVPPPVQVEILRALLPETKRVLNTWAPTLDWCAIARGRAEFLVAYDTEAEDLVQGMLILEEAGGRITTWDKYPLRLDLTRRQRVTLLATNGAVHESLGDLLNGVSLGSSLQGYVSIWEEDALEIATSLLRAKLRTVTGSVAERISVELGLARETWERNTDLRYLVARADALQSDPKSFVRDLFTGIAPHLSGEKSRRALLDALRRTAESWELEKHPVEVVAQAMEIAASDIRLHDQMQLSGYDREVIEDLSRILAEDSFAVGGRLKRNHYRKIRALEKTGESDPLPPVRLLRDALSPKAKVMAVRAGTKDSFAALIITGGRGTRLRTSVPKGLIPLNRRPLVNYTVEAFQVAGATDIALVVGYKGNLHRPILGDGLVFLEQAEQHGTAHAIMTARDYFAGYEGPLLISYSDMPFIEGQTLRALVDKHCAEHALMTFLTTDRTSRPEFGRVLRKDGKVCGIGQVRFEAVESDEVDAGFYCFQAPEFWDYLGRIQNANNRREFVLTEIVTHLSVSGEKIETLLVKDIVQTIGINRPSELLQAECIAYTRSKLQNMVVGPSRWDGELYWKLRFFEAFGGARTDDIFKLAPDPLQPSAAAILISEYESAAQQGIGAIFRCPAVMQLPLSMTGKSP